MVAGVVKPEPTWRSRLYGVWPPPLKLDRPYAQANTVSDPWPLIRQTDLPADNTDYLRTIVGRYPLGAQLVRLARSLGAWDQDALGLAPPPPPAPTELGCDANPVRTTVNRLEHTTYARDVPAGGTVEVFQADSQCAYALVINSGANPAFLAYNENATARSLPLAAAGVGFHELVFGTKSWASVFSPLGTFVTVVQGFYDPPLESC